MRRSALIAALVVAIPLLPLPAWAESPSVYVNDARELVILGAFEGQNAGEVLANAGDVNGDGVDDLVVGTDLRSSEDSSSERESDFAYVVFGGAAGDLDLANLGDRGFAVNDPRPHRGSKGAQMSVAGVGDVNGDGLDDVAVADPFADNNGEDSGSVYVVFGKTDSSRVRVDGPTVGFVRLDGAGAGDFAGSSTAAAGDVDADGKKDLIVGAPYAGADPAGPGAAYVVFGRALTSNVELGNLGDGGYVIAGSGGNRRRLGWSVSGVGDLNADGIPEAVVGAPSRSHKVRGSAYVVFGKTTAERVDTANLGTRGWEIRGAQRGDELGTSLAAGEDFNGDGIPDILVGAPRYERNDLSAGAAYVVFGRSDGTLVRLRELGGAGVSVLGAGGEELGRSVAMIEDVTQDGRSEAIIGSPYSSHDGLHSAGAAHIVFGRPDGGETRSDDLGAGGISFLSNQEFAYTGGSVAAGGSFTIPAGVSIAVGSIRSGTADRLRAGVVFLLPATATPIPRPPMATLLSFEANQVGTVGPYCWKGQCSEAQPEFPEMDEAAPGDRAILRFGTTNAPERIAVKAYREVTAEGEVVGEPIELRTRIRPHDSFGERVAYDALFTLPKVRGELFLLVTGSWPGSEGGESTWRFHLSLRGRRHTDMPFPPEAALRANRVSQLANYDSFCWSNSHPDGTGVTSCVEVVGGGRPPASETTRAGRRAFIRIVPPFKPDRFRLKMFRRLSDDGHPSGRARDVRFRWRRHSSGGEVVAYDAMFRLPNKPGSVFHVARARWRGHGEQTWYFHVRLKRPR